VTRARPGEPLEEALLRAGRHELVSLMGEALAAPTRVALACDPAAIAMRAWVEAAPPLLARVVTPNGPVWEDECVELFVSSPGEPARYLEVVVNALGVAYAARVYNPAGSRQSWTITRGVVVEGLRVSAKGDGAVPESFRRWTATIEVPWRALGGPPSRGEIRTGNVTRIARGRATRFEALSPTLRCAPPDVHVPARFARLLFP
jgi:hypothetical protein